MKKKPLSLTLAWALLAFALGASSSGCFYVTDSIRGDARAAAKLPEAAIDGLKRDVDIYRPVPTIEGSPAGSSGTLARGSPAVLLEPPITGAAAGLRPDGGPEILRL